MILRNEKYEEIAVKTHNENLSLWTFIITMKRRVNDTYNTMVLIDRKGSFQTDDEIEIIFKQLKNTLEELDIYLNERIEEKENSNKEIQ